MYINTILNIYNKYTRLHVVVSKKQTVLECVLFTLMKLIRGTKVVLWNIVFPNNSVSCTNRTHTDKYQRASFSPQAKCFLPLFCTAFAPSLLFFGALEPPGWRRRSLATALVHDHVLVVPQQHFSALVVQHA